MPFYIGRLAIRQRIMPMLNPVSVTVFCRTFTEGRLVPDEKEAALPSREKNGCLHAWEERLGTRVEGKNEKLDIKIEQKFAQLLDINAKTNTRLGRVSVDVRSLKTMTTILYSIIISGIVGGGAILVYFIKDHFNRHDRTNHHDLAQDGSVSRQKTKDKESCTAGTQ